MTTVCLHIGCFKTGTSHIQQTLETNRAALRDAGVLWPGKSFADQVKWTRFVKSGDEDARAAWVNLSREIDEWNGPTAVLSMEFLSLVGSEGVARAMEALSAHDVRVVLTVRDMGRTVPAQWQESVQHQNDWSYADYLRGISGTGGRQRKANRHFWSRHDWPGILKTWAPAASAGTTVVVVPPPQADRGLLWERFASVVDVDASRYSEPAAMNESLGAASAEVMRYAARTLNNGSYSAAAIRKKKRVLAKSLLAARKSEEPTLVLPPELHDWARSTTQKMVDELRSISPDVVGDLAELTPQFGATQVRTVTDPSALPCEELLAAAGDGLMGLCAALAQKND